MSKIFELLAFVYGPDQAATIEPRIRSLIDEMATSQASKVATYFDQTDALLITYGDMVQQAGEAPLQTLRNFLQQHIAGIVKGVHILPFYPYSSDDGFSVIDYLQVDPDLGDWDDVRAFQASFRLMFDAVINHISQHSAWFSAFKQGEPPYTDYFTVADPDADYSTVFRPRALPLLTPVDTPDGIKHVWTTFSADQIDLNFASPDLLLDVLRVLLAYAQNGAELIRLDAIGFMWKELGTSCMHLPQTHALIQLMRSVLDEAAPQVALVSETNVPHRDNISYFGDGSNEAQMVYNFSLPPLLLHTFHSGDATVLTRWAATLEQPSDRTTFFNFCASHDGIGVTPARGLLSNDEIAAIAQRVEALGGFVSYKSNGDGTQSAYELNINYMDALGAPNCDESDALRARRFLCSQAVMLALRGVPGIYFHSLFGSRGWLQGVAETGRNRSINREKLELGQLEHALKDGLRKLVFDGYCALLRARSAEIAFHPNGDQTLLSLHPSVVAIDRRHQGRNLLAVHNVSSHSISVELPASGVDLLTSSPLLAGSHNLEAYQVLWLLCDQHAG